MRTSNIIKKLLGRNETIQYKFSLSKRYLKLKMIAALLIASIFLGLFIFIIVYFDNLQDFGHKSINQFFQTNYSDDLEYRDWEESNIFTENDGRINNILLITVLGFLIIIVPIICFYYLYYLKISNEYVFTNQRVLIKRGWLSTKATSVHYNRITDVSVSQTIIDRLLKIGALSISTAGSEGYEVSLSHINKPHQIKRTMYDLKQDYQQTLINNQHNNNEHLGTVDY